MGGINDAFDSQNIAAQLDYFRRSDEQREALVEVGVSHQLGRTR